MLEDHEFYELFPPHMHYYVVERTAALNEIDVDHLRVVHDRRIYIATEEEIDVPGLKKLEAPVPPPSVPEEETFDDVDPANIMEGPEEETLEAKGDL